MQEENEELLKRVEVLERGKVYVPPPQAQLCSSREFKLEVDPFGDRYIGRFYDGSVRNFEFVYS